MLTEPLPYHPRLCKLLGGVTISIVLVYLEIHHSQPEPITGPNPGFAGLKNPPVYVDCDQACDDLGVSRRTLQTTLESLGVWWKAEMQRSAAARSGRDFIKSGRSFPSGTHMGITPYAFVGSREFNAPRILAVHRNLARLDQILTDAGILQTNNFVPITQTSAPTNTVDSLAGALGIGPIPRGLAWGWSEERRKAASERMTAKWLKWREIASK